MVKNIKTSKSSLQFLEYTDNLMDLHKEIDYFMPLILRSEKFGAFIPNLCSKTPLILRSEKFGASPVDDQQIMEKAGNEKCKNPLILPAKKYLFKRKLKCTLFCAFTTTILFSQEVHLVFPGFFVSKYVV